MMFGEKEWNPVRPTETVQPGSVVVSKEHLSLQVFSSLARFCPLGFSQCLQSRHKNVSSVQDVQSNGERLVHRESRANLFLSITRCSPFPCFFFLFVNKLAHNSVLCPVKLAGLKSFFTLLLPYDNPHTLSPCWTWAGCQISSGLLEQ